MRVLLINEVCGHGSTGKICTDLAEVCESEGFDVKIAYGRDAYVPERFKKYAVRIGSNFDVVLHALQTRIFDNTGFCSKAATEKFIEWVKVYNPDIIHLHNLHGYYINIKVLFDYLAETNKPVVWTLHDCWAFTGHCAHYILAKCDKWKTGCYKCPRKKGYPSSLIFDASEKNWEKKKALFTSVKNMTLVTPSQWLANEVKQSFLNKYPVKVIPNGIDLDVFKPTPSDFREKNGLVGKKIILGVATAWGPGKGLNDFISLSKIIGNDCKIVLVGLSEKQKMELPKSILGITRTHDAHELAAIYTTADVLFNLTYGDTYPTVNLEAQACGTPVVTYRTGGSVESVPEENVVEQGMYKNLVYMNFNKISKVLNKREASRNYIGIYGKIVGSKETSKENFK